MSETVTLIPTERLLDRLPKKLVGGFSDELEQILEERVRKTGHTENTDVSAPIRCFQKGWRA